MTATDTTREAVERLAADLAAGWSDGDEAAATLRALLAEREAALTDASDFHKQSEIAYAERDAAHGYLSRLIQTLHPEVQPLPDLMGTCTQIDNIAAGLRADLAAARAEAQRMRERIEAILDAFRCISPEAVIRAREAGEKTEIGNALEAAQDELEGRADG